MKKVSFLFPVLIPFIIMRAKIIAGLLFPYIKNNSKLLDIGCGNMLVAKELWRLTNAAITGIDVIDMNLTKLPHLVYDGHRLPFGNKSFDTSFFVGVLHHNQSQLKLLKETIRVTSNTIIIFEDVYFSKIENYWLKIRDVVGNIPEEPKMSFAFTFRSCKEWEEIFYQLRLTILSKKVIFNPLRLAHHALYVLSVDPHVKTSP